MRVFQGVRGATASRVVVRAAGCACTVRTTVAACPVTNVTRKSVCRRGRICRPGEQTRLTETLGALVAEAVGLRVATERGESGHSSAETCDGLPGELLDDFDCIRLLPHHDVHCLQVAAHPLVQCLPSVLQFVVGGVVVVVVVV